MMYMILNKDPYLQSERGLALKTLIHLFTKNDNLKAYKG